MSSNRLNRRSISGMIGSFSFLPQITDRTSDQFLDEIIKIHENQYTPINHFPTIFGRKINLLVLYNAVAKRGGFKKMNTESSWEGVLSDLKMPTKCANASVALRSIFQRYLEPFERLQRNKATINDIEEELQMESENRYKSTAQRTTLTHCNFNPISMVYRADMHQLSSHRRLESGLSCDLSDVVEFQKLELSLRSGLVNEVEFSLNTILLMSFQTDGIQLCRNHRLLDLILNSIGLGDLASLRDLYEYDRATRRFLRFWNDNIVLEGGRKFLIPDIFSTDLYYVPEADGLNQMFRVDDELTVYDKEGQRIQLVLTIIRNLALDASNSHFITQNHQCMRLIMLCCYASHFALRQLGLEVLSMLSFPVVGILSESLGDFLVDLVNGEDRVDRLRGLELIAHLSDQKVCLDNKDFLSGLPKQIFASLISMLIFHDLHIVVLALEAVYALSEVDHCLCTKLVECSCETLSTLYILLSLEAQVMGTQSLIRIRVMQGPATTSGCSTSIQSAGGKLSMPQSPSNHKQLATSLMPPPPVPTHKIPTTTVLIPYSNSQKSQIYATTEAMATQNKPQITQKIYPIINKNNAVFATNQTNVTAQNSVPQIVKTELTTVCSNPLITTESAVYNNLNMRSPPKPCLNSFSQSNDSSSSRVADVNDSMTPTTVTIPPLSSCNHNYPSKPSVISANISNQRPRPSEPTQTIVKPILSSSAVHIVNANSFVDSASNNVVDHVNPLSTTTHIPSIQTFANKQDFVKSWLLNNYLEASQCTVPLFVMYKQLQVAVQNYFKDSEMVTAEEFHKLVRILFPQVQLVQLHTSGGSVEIHYYNLKVSPKATTMNTLLDSHASKLKQIIANSNDTYYSANNVPQQNCAQSNCIVAAPRNNDLQKQIKRHATDLVNGHSAEAEQSDIYPKKRPKSNDEFVDVNPIYNRCTNSTHITSDTKAVQINNYLNNGQAAPKLQNSEYHKNHSTVPDERLCQSNQNLQTNQILNWSAVEDLKHSDSETKAFSSSTVSPIHCESLANGTDGSSEETLDSDLGKVIANIPTPGSQTTIPLVSASAPIPITVNSGGGGTPTPSATANPPDINNGKRSLKKNNFNQLGRTRSRFRNNNPASKGKQRGSSSQRPHNLSYLYICEWDNCLQSFDKPQKVYGHVYTNHFMTLRTEVESMCYWSGCKDTTQRTPLPLLNHVNEQHCNNIALEAARQIRLAKENETAPPNIPESHTIKTEPDTFPRLLNFCSSQPSPLSTTVTSTSSSYQHIPLSSSAPSTTVVTTSMCSSSVASISSTPSNAISTPSISTTEEASSCPSPSTVTSPVGTLVTTVAPTVSQNIALLPSSGQANEPSAPEESPSRPQSGSVAPKTQGNLPATTSSSAPVNQSCAVPIPSLPPAKHNLKEGPVTKHIRFLSALILRNLCQCSPEARRFVAAHHQQIFEMSISGCESSRALSECLYYSSVEITSKSHHQK